MGDIVKRTYSLPQTVLTVFEEAVEPGKRSAVIASLIQDWLEARRRETLRKVIIEGCSEMRDVYLEIEAEYHPLEEEAHRAIDK